MTVFNGIIWHSDACAPRQTGCSTIKKLFESSKLTRLRPWTNDRRLEDDQQQRPDVAPIGLGTRGCMDGPVSLDWSTQHCRTGRVEQFYTGQIDPQGDPAIRRIGKIQELIRTVRVFTAPRPDDIPVPLCEGQIAMMVIGDFAAADMSCGYQQA